jgi:phenylacetate-coenzyme A ligase PaaK-like adenylate-forming protein
MLKRFLGSGLYTKFDGVLDRVSSSRGKESDELPNVQETEWFSEDQIIEYQEKRLRKLIQYAYNEIPYY